MADSTASGRRFGRAALWLAVAGVAVLLAGCTPDGSGGKSVPAQTGAASTSARGTTGPTSKSAAKSYTVVLEVHGSGAARNMVWHIGSESHLGGEQVKPGSPVHIQRTVTADDPFQVTLFANTDPGADLRCSIAVNGTVVVEQSNTVRGLSCETTVRVG